MSSGYRRVLSQLFDVKPMRDSADLDWEKIERVERILNLRGTATAKEIRMRREALILNHASRVARLRENESLVFVKKDKEAEKEKLVNIRPESATPHLLFDDYFALSKLKSSDVKDGDSLFSDMDVDDGSDEVLTEAVGPFDNDESVLIEDGYPTREEILRELEEVDALDTQDRGMENAVPSIAFPQQSLEQLEEDNDDEWEDIAEDLVEKEGDSFSYSTPPVYIRAGIISFIAIAFSLSLVFPIASFLNKGNNVRSSAFVAGVGSSETNLIQGDSASLSDSTINSSVEIFNKSDDNFLFDKFFAFLRSSGDKYLLLFQDYNEMRSTGGFLEAYGILDTENSSETELFIDDIFNLDSQLNVNIIPPRPIQKVSTAWSMHDVNWFSDFPTSAEKALWFYKKIGNESLDGVITFTPQVVIQLLEAVGPVSMPEYGIEITSENFAETVRGEMEENFDDVLSQAQNIFVDFVPLFIEKIKNSEQDARDRIASILLENLKEKHILMYFVNDESEKFILDQEWGGEMKEFFVDFLSVINSNLDGYKTERMVDEEISHVAEIQRDGSIIDTVEIKRTHRGNSRRDHANLSYTRVYVPQGAELLEASGHTVETYTSPINYKDTNFKPDPLVEQIESSIKIHRSGTEVFQESGKTVFGNWIYVEPGKSVTVTYKYKLPFKLFYNGGDYSLTVQKQSGSIGSDFKGRVIVPDNFRVRDGSGNVIEVDGILDTDLFYKIKLISI